MDYGSLVFDFHGPMSKRFSHREHDCHATITKIPELRGCKVIRERPIYPIYMRSKLYTLVFYEPEDEVCSDVLSKNNRSI